MADLWTRAVDLRPKTLARNILNCHDDVQSTSPKISLHDLSDYGFDLTKNMGKVLIKSKHVAKDSFLGLANAYEGTFLSLMDRKKRPHNDLVHAITACKKDLSSIESIRNLLSHRGGRVDQRFRLQVETDAELSLLKEGDAFTTDGEMVRKYMRAVTVHSFRLLGFVGKWLEEHEE